MATIADNSRDGLVSQLQEVWRDLAELGASLDDASWTTATPCPGWDVAAQYAHVIGTESMLLSRPNPEAAEKTEQPAHVRNQIGGFNEVWVEHLAGHPRAEVLAQFDEIVAARTEALAGMTEADFEAPSWTPVGQADYRRFMQIRVFDCWVHDQDIRDAVGRPGFETGPVVDQSIDEIVRALGFVVGKKAGAPQGSSVRFELTAPVARRVDVDVAERARVVDALAGEPAVTLRMASGAFTRLACGRVAPGAVEVSMDGDAELGRRVVDNLAFTI
ncbi:MAG TPA: maleylpyruvate isomerase family mycothiol-dependent enzyme [Acidimicrobiales bacterium]|nr:maleylpyruvate isomerase family mycothiol-dependent enzyme [Acidimicrobiales bacterium]